MVNNMGKNRFEKLREERRFVVVPVDIGFIGKMLIDESVQYKFNGLPSDVIFIHADRDIQQQTFQFIYLHESFDKVPEGEIGPLYHGLSVTRIPHGSNK